MCSSSNECTMYLKILAIYAVLVYRAVETLFFIEMLEFNE